MKIIITSILDPWKSGHYSRLHQFMGWLSKNHDITIISINDYWKSSRDDKYQEFGQEFEDLRSKVRSFYLTESGISPIRQEIFSIFKAKDLGTQMDFSDFDVHLNYNTLISGYYVGKKMQSCGINTVYDVADDLPAMVGSSPQIPSNLRSLGYMAGKVFMNMNIGLSKKVILTVDSLRDNINIDNDKAVTIPNGVDTDLFKYANPENGFCADLGIKDAFTVGYVGSLREWVNFKPLFEAISALKNKINIKMLIVGGGDTRPALVEMASLYGISDRVIFTGTIPYSKIHKYISVMDVCTIPFNQDMVAKNSLPLKFFEYLSCGKPVISSSIEGVINAVDGNVFLADTRDQYISQLMHVHANRDDIMSDSNKRRELIKDRFSWSTINPRFEQVLKEVSK